ncbi:hypothetical protein NDU88_001840 [Pleurodeles waltl]|uniref:TGF-beta propeptide domain-containing protein n=1 Tax=Pleurodeles waltl TaxID=8319 RepID=A0AAV7T1G4_PLEWA|nr:hypothetical protein NDU88_001840 [Pleurodeles waltl]
MVKRKRIEAIRGQILSKLKLDKPPEVENEVVPVPEEVMVLYNSTLELIQETQSPKTHEAPEDEYFAKEVQKFNMVEDKVEKRATLALESKSNAALRDELVGETQDYCCLVEGNVTRTTWMPDLLASDGGVRELL